MEWINNSSWKIGKLDLKSRKAIQSNTDPNWNVLYKNTEFYYKKANIKMHYITFLINKCIYEIQVCVTMVTVAKKLCIIIMRSLLSLRKCAEKNNMITVVRSHWISQETHFWNNS